MKKLSLIIAVTGLVIGSLILAAAPTVKRITNITTTQAGNVFLPVGYNELVCDGWVHYKMVTTNSATVATTDPMVKGSRYVPSKPINLNVAAGTQYLALLLDTGSPATCSVKQISTDGQTGSFTTLAVSSTSAFTGAITAASTAYIQGATTIDGALGSGGVISGTFDGGTARLGATSMSSIDLPSSTQLTAIKFGSITLGGQSPATGTATVLSGQKCNCTPETNAADGVTKCNVSSTTLTATGPNSSTGVINYFCWK